jgi:hypothetical protein
LVLFPCSVLPPKHPTDKIPLPVAFLTAPTIGAPPLTGNSVAPPMPSPLRRSSLLPISPIWAWTLPLPHSCRAAGVPRGNADHRPDFPRHRPPPHRILSATPPSRHLLGEPLPLSPCPAHPPLNVGAYTGRHFPPRPPGCRRAPRYRAAPCAVTAQERRSPAPGAVGSRLPRPFWPSELSGPPAHERRMPWAECEAQYCAAVLIIFQFI